MRRMTPQPPLFIIATFKYMIKMTKGFSFL
jgi:hypothetical protein